ncbi:TRAP transporter substrate-binding protein DctP [Chelativorans sp. AA-79]|uniref:TRAP transporter substrate-binding protein n=1 Tax=Chelativorans sp. AA-79 TaxID=3028735 RepID=UPI0023F6E6A3|nr:TRAP transporter substrate-binding protein DctP [Chelativorans sp. AA-79]WEX09673.1 TRAP transporter substrate-binding protein DctP [Chelativorans sp. AA-79]
MKYPKFLMAASLIASAVAAGASSAQEITLRAADSLPVGHYISEGVLLPLMKQVTESTDGRVAFEHFPAQQLGKSADMFSLVKSGVADIAYVGASYVSDKLPLSSVGELPEAFSSSCEGTLAFWELAKPGGVLDKAEYQPEGVRALAVLVLAPYQVFLSEEMSGLANLKGKRIVASGAPKHIGLTKLGAVPTTIAAPEAREALSRGTVDGLAFPIASIRPYDLAPELSSATDNTNFGSFTVVYMMSQSKYDSLPEDAQQALTEAGEAATRHGCEYTDEATANDRQVIMDAGVRFVTLSEEDRSALEASMASVGDEWAAELDARGKAGTEVLNAFRNALGK